METFISVENSYTGNTILSDGWNAQLFSIDRRKCIYFVQKRTLYSVILLDIVKQDLKQINSLFFKALVEQLKTDKLYQRSIELYLYENYSSLRFFKTDNDQKTLGTMRDDMARLTMFIDEAVDKFAGVRKCMNYALNSVPIGTKDYISAKELMAEELKTHA